MVGTIIIKKKNLGEQRVNSRHLVRLFFSTLLVGGITAGVVGVVSRWGQFQSLIESKEYIEILMTFIWLVGLGLIFSVISQMGFFSYLTIHRFGLGIFKNLWNAVQLVIVMFVLFDLVYLRYIAFGEGGSLASYILIAVLILVVALIVAFIKVKLTNKHAFIPALFFMVVATVIEWVPVLRENDQAWLYFMLVPLLVCNSYQLLTLQRINQKSAEELGQKKARVQMNTSKV